MKPIVHARSWASPATSHRAQLVAASQVPLHLISNTAHALPIRHHLRLFTTTTRCLSKNPNDNAANDETSPPPPPPPQPKLTHLTPTGAAHMVPIAHKPTTARTARAVCAVHFSSPTAAQLIRANGLKKGDVLGVARIAGIMAAKRTPDLVPLCHPILLSHVGVDLALAEDRRVVDVAATVACEGRTGVEMEALTAAMAAALTVYDMCKAVDRGIRIEGLRVVLKEGGKSGRWVEGVSEEE